MVMEKAEREVIDTEQRLAAAYAQCNTGEFNLLVLDDCVFADEGRIRTKSEECKYVTRTAHNIKVSLAYESSTIRVHGDFTLAIGRLSETVETGGTAPTTSRFLVSDCLLRRSRMWKLAARHQTRVPETKQEIVLEQPLLTRNTGEYLFSSGIKLVVVLKDHRLYACVAGGEEQHLRPLSQYEFFAAAFDAEITFIPDAHDRVNTIMLKQAGTVSFAYKH